MRVLLTGLSEERIQNKMVFPSLPGVPAELQSIETITKGRKLMNQAYTLPELTREFKNEAYTVLHLATHGIFGGRAEDTFLLTYDGRMTMNRLESLIQTGMFRENNVDLLTLSACQTAQGNEQAAFGLAGIAVKAGVKSAIATLWSVDDAATSRLLSEYYRQYAAGGVSKAKALQIAQKKLIEQPRFWHPSFWSPFLLIGNWH